MTDEMVDGHYRGWADRVADEMASVPAVHGPRPIPTRWPQLPFRTSGALCGRLVRDGRHGGDAGRWGDPVAGAGG